MISRLSHTLSSPKPPTKLPASARKLWRSLQSEYSIVDAGGLAILEAACRAFARASEAEAVLNAEGLTMRDAKGNEKARPEVAIERDARAQYLSALKLLSLDVEPLKPGIGRPGGSPGPQQTRVFRRV